MYVWARLLSVMATARRRGPHRIGSESRLAFRCLPTDIDTNLHLNNARYLMLADLGRIDIFVRAGLLKLARERGWVPILGGLQSAFVREIGLWQRFDLVSSIETWTGTQAIGSHRFILESGETAAIVMTTAGVYDRANRRFLEIDEMTAALDQRVEPRPPTEAEKMFMALHKDLRAQAKASG